MRKDTQETWRVSRAPEWETLEAWTRAKIQEAIPAVLEAEVTERLGQAKSVRRAAVDAPPGYRTGDGKPRRLALTSGAIMVRRPRVRGLEERFASRLLPLFRRRTQEGGSPGARTLPPGLAQGAFELALRGLAGDGAPLSPSSIARLKARSTCWTRCPGRCRPRLGACSPRSPMRPRAAFPCRSRRWDPKAVTVLQHDWERLVTC
jgi:hypothetical protein